MSSKAFDIKFVEKPPEFHVYERFKRKIFEYLEYNNVDAAISLSKLFGFIEKTVMVLGMILFLIFLCLEKKNLGYFW